MAAAMAKIKTVIHGFCWGGVELEIGERQTGDWGKKQPDQRSCERRPGVPRQRCVWKRRSLCRLLQQRPVSPESPLLPARAGSKIYLISSVVSVTIISIYPHSREYGVAQRHHLRTAPYQQHTSQQHRWGEHT